MSDRLRIGLLVAIVLLAYGNTLGNEFTQDDTLYILRNSRVTSPTLGGLFEPVEYTNIFRPVTFGSFALNWMVDGAHPLGYHLGNLLLQAIVTVLLFLTLKRLLDFSPQGPLVAWVAALVFAVHPIHTEAVASVVGRAELLAAGFLLTAWLLHLENHEIAVVICFALALLSKESALAFVPLVIVGDYVRGKWKALYAYVATAVTAVAYLALLWKVQGGHFGAASVVFLDNPLGHLPAKLRILNAVRIAWKYIGIQIYPGKLSSDYSYNAILLYANLRHLAPAAIAAVLLMAVWLWTLKTNRKEWFLAGTIYVAGFAITANILVPTGTIMGERLAYLPSAGYCLLVALIWIWLLKRQGKLAWTVLAIFLAALTVRTIVRNRDWHDNFTLFSADVKVVPGSAKIHSNLGVMYYTRGDKDAASKELQTALHIYRDLPEAMAYNALIESNKGHDLDAEKLLETALTMTPQSSPNYDFMIISLAEILVKEGRSDQALKLLDGEIARSAGSSRAWSARAALRYRGGDLGGARADAEMAVRLDGGNEQAKRLLAVLNGSAQ